LTVARTSLRNESLWYRRASRALSDATEEQTGIPPKGQAQEWQSSPEYGEQISETELSRRTGQAAERVRQHFGSNFENVRQNIVEWHQAMDPESRVSSWLIENESPIPGAIMQYTSDNPEILRTIAELPPRKRDLALATLQG
jgi:hypothetical protein